MKRDSEYLLLLERLAKRAPKEVRFLEVGRIVASLQSASRSYHRHAEAQCNGDYYRRFPETTEGGELADKAEAQAENRIQARVTRLLDANPWLKKVVRIDYQGDPRAGVGFVTVVLPRTKRETERGYYV